jgi:TonB-linked SusC/RagA family outer membrane protein
VDFKYSLSKQWSAAAMVGINYAKISEELFIPSYGVGYIDGTEYERQAGRNVNNFSNINGDFRVEYSKQFAGKHLISAKLGLRYYGNQLSNDNNSDFSMPNDEFKGLGSGSIQAATTALDKKRFSSYSGAWKSISNYFVACYSFDNKYYANFAMAMDMSSQFTSDKVGYFPSLNLGWRLTEESFLSNNSFLNELKLRAGISISGNDKIAYFAAREYYEAQRYRTATGLVKKNLGNDDLKWETTRTINIGTDIFALKNRLGISMDLFTSKTKDVVLFEILPVMYGYDGYWKNSATTGSNGFELSASYLVLNIGSFKWNIGGNIWQARAKVISLPDGEPIITNIPGGQIITQEGGPLYQFYGYKSTGVYSSLNEVPAGLISADRKLYGAGDMIYAEVIEDGVIDDNDRQVIGNADADSYGGIQTSMSFKAFTLGASFDFMNGNEVFNYTRMQVEGMTTLTNQTSAVNKRWTTEGEKTSIPRVSVNMPENAAFSSRWIESGSYMRFRSLYLSYDFPKVKGKINGIKVFAQADNLFIWSKYLGNYPVFSFGRNSSYQGIDYGKEPQSRSILFGIKLDL